MSSPSRIRRVLLGIVVVPVASAVVVEAGSRAFDRVRGKPWNAEERRAAIEQTCRMLSRQTFVPGGDRNEERAESATSAAILHPYTAWEHPRTQERIADELERYRRAEAKDVYDISILGGSVAKSFAELGERRLRDRLQRDPRFQGREIRIHDDACDGYKQPQPLMSLSFLLSMGHEPDAVIEIDGFNEAALGWTNARISANPAYPFLPNWASATQELHLDDETLDDLHAALTSQDRAREFGEWMLSSGCLRSSFLGHAGGLRLASLRSECATACERYTDRLQENRLALVSKGPRFQEGGEATIQGLAACWEEASVSMKGLCVVRGITYLHVLQPALADRGTKPLTQKEVDGGVAEPSWIEGVKRVYPSLREAGGRLEARGIAFFDATGVFRDHPEDVYVDVCHFGEHGNEILADAIADALIRAEKQ